MVLLQLITDTTNSIVAADTTVSTVATNTVTNLVLLLQVLL
jgi:hypothetical protein